MGSVVDSSALLFRSGYFYEPLTGLGERSHLVTREIGLDTHIVDVTQVLEHEDLNEVTLVGHSYGGLVVHHQDNNYNESNLLKIKIHHILIKIFIKLERIKSIC